MSAFRDPFWTWEAQTPTKKKNRLYKKYGNWAKSAKIYSQFIIGSGLIILLAVKLFCSVFRLSCHLVQPLVALNTLQLVANALEYSAGVELAYTLFTEGPDEAVEPVIMGLAAAMLLVISKLEKIDVFAACAAFIFVIALAGLFLIRHYFVQPEEDDDEQSAAKKLEGHS
jgi:hypothetical protein